MTKAQWGELGGNNSLKADSTIMCVYKDGRGNIYTGGLFTNSNGKSYVAKWNGTSWSELAGSDSLNANAPITSIISDKQGNIYVAGYFTDANNKCYVAKWNGTNWSQVGSSFSNSTFVINSMCFDKLGNLYIAGNITNVSGLNYVAKWDGISWTELGGTNSLYASTNIVFQTTCTDTIGNVFVAATDSSVIGRMYIAKYNGTKWSELRSSSNKLNANGNILSICSDKKGNIYAAGDFTNSSGKHYVAKWNGTTWTELGSGTNRLLANAYIYCICIDTLNNVYAVGDFTNTNGNRYVAKWNGTKWTELGGANLLAANQSIYNVFADSLNNIYAVGDFTNNSNKRYVAIYSVLPLSNNISGKITSPNNDPIKNVTINYTGGCAQDDISGNFNISLTSGGNYTFVPFKNNDINKANGVTALDISLVQSHILAKSLLNSPYKLIAADVNGDGKVTALDIVYMKRLILAIDTTFTNSTTKQTRLWAFVDSSYKFPDTTNPFPYKDSISYTGLSASKTNQTFIGCKLGDVNWDWNPAIPKPMMNNSNAVELSYSYPSDALPGRADGYVHIPVRVKNFKEMVGMQFTINFDPAIMQWQGIGNNTLGIETGTNQAAEGSVSFLWVDPKNEIKTLEDGSLIMELVFKTIDNGKLIIDNENTNTLKLDGSVTAIAAYDKEYQLHNVVMKRVEKVQPLQQEYWTVAPNPTKDGVIHVQMNLKDKKTIVFRLIDNAGKLLLVKQIEGVKGSNNITLREGNIAGGTYYLQAVGVEGVKQLRIEN